MNLRIEFLFGKPGRDHPVTHSFSRRLRIPSFLLAATIALGCGGSADTNDTAAKAEAPKLDACQLFTYEDAQAIAGESLAAMASTLDEAQGRNPGECIYNAGTIEQPRILSLLIRHHRSPESAKRVLEGGRSTFSSMTGGQVQDVTGLGDGALWVGGRLQQLHVLRGEAELVITLQSADGTDQLQNARTLAEKILSRMGKA
jgi:hypothetical protein